MSVSWILWVLVCHGPSD